MRALIQRLLVLLAVIGLIVAPPVSAGYTELQQATLAQNAGHSLQAAAHYRHAASLLPWRNELWEYAGLATFVADPSGAIPLLERVHHLSRRGWVALGSAYFLSGEIDLALDRYQTALEIYGPEASILLGLEMVYRQKGDWASELAVLQDYLDLVPGDAGVHYRAGLLSALSEPEQAFFHLSNASSLDPANYEAPADTLRTALNLSLLERDEARGLIVIGRGLGLVNEWALAHEAFQRAVRADATDAEAWAWLGEAEQQLDRDGRAELDRALSLGSSNPIVRSLRGLYWMRQNQADQALAEYHFAAEHDPENPAWRVSIGEAYSLKGDLQVALESYLDAVEIAPSEATYWRLMAEFCARYEMQVEEYGLPAAQAAVELSGEDPLALDTLGWILALLGRYDEAQDTLEHALSLDPELASPHLHLGILALQRDDWEAAREHCQKARDLDPGGPVGEQARRLLDQYFP